MEFYVQQSSHKVSHLKVQKYIEHKHDMQKHVKRNTSYSV